METEKKTKEIKFVDQYGSKILFLIDNQDNLTRSDLQGAIDAVILLLIRDVQAGALS